MSNPSPALTTIQERPSEYSEGVCGDGAAILRDGQPVSIKWILEALESRDLLIEALRPFAEKAKVFSQDDWKDTSFVGNPYNTSKGRFALTVGDLRKALAAIEKATRGNEDSALTKGGEGS